MTDFPYYYLEKKDSPYYKKLCKRILDPVDDYYCTAIFEDGHEIKTASVFLPFFQQFSPDIPFLMKEFGNSTYELKLDSDKDEEYLVIIKNKQKKYESKFIIAKVVSVNYTEDFYYFEDLSISKLYKLEKFLTSLDTDIDYAALWIRKRYLHKMVLDFLMLK